jgi:serine/threonine protein kinase
MTDTPGSALEGRYRIVRELGAGGMATVFLADDLRHERKVAIKVLKPELAAVIGAERFLREIKTIASLQHPHILGLIDSGQMDGTAFYVMPFVEGESLRDRLAREKQLPVPEAVRLASEVAAALDYAHRHGVIHRDIKPENILLHDGRALVADFGIALAVSKAGGTRMTETGMSLGTPQYMSPEQAMGEREVAAESDVYALGVVTYEMLVGEPPFTGPTAQAIVARVVTEEPRRLVSQRGTIPQHVESAVFTALEKLPADRFRSTKEFADALGRLDYTSARSAARPAVASRANPWKGAAIGFAILSAVIAIVAAVTTWSRDKAPRPISRYGITFPDSAGPSIGMWLSPDGSRLFFGRPEISGRIALWVKERDRYEPSKVSGADNVEAFSISPDGQWIALVQAATLWKLPVTGGTPVKLADSVFFGGAAWLDDGTIVYTSTKFALKRVTADGIARGTLREPSGGRAPVFLQPLPGSRGILYTLCSAACTQADLYVFDLEADSAIRLVEGTLQGWYLPTGHLAHVGRDSRMIARPFDLGTLKVSGTPVPLLEGITIVGGLVPFVTFSASGTLIAQTGQPGGVPAENMNLVWVDRTGARTPLDSGWHFRLGQDEGNYGWSLSPDGRRLVINITTNSGDDVWTKELPRGGLSRLTFDASPEFRPRFSSDGETVTYMVKTDPSLASGILVRRRADGRGGIDTLLSTNVFEGFVTGDGWVIARTGGDVGGNSRDIIGMRLGTDGTPRPLMANPAYDEAAPAVSPDGKWIAYESDETGRTEVYLRPFPDTDGGKWQVSENGGEGPLWAKSGRELFFVDANRRMVAINVSAGSSPGLSARRTLFTLDEDLFFSNLGFYTPFDISPDDSRFLMAGQTRPSNSRGPTTFLLVENWFEDVRARMKAAQ